MANFTQAFWSSDYAGGLGVIFGKLQQGVQENQQLLTIARMRADAEELYGQHNADIAPTVDRIADGFSIDDGASVRKAYDGVRTEMVEAGRKHHKIAANIRELVVYPFGRWADQHAARVQNSHDDLQSRIKAHDKQAELVRRLRSQYFNKCRLVEDLDEEDKLAFKEPETNTSPQSPPPTVKIQEPEEEPPEPQRFEIGGQEYEYDQVKRILLHMMENVPMRETKVPILGTYQNTSTGAEIVEYIQSHMNGTTVGLCEHIGQDMINTGFLRLIGNVGNDFANSSRMKYQWRPKVFQITGIPENRKSGIIARSNTTGLTRTSTAFSDMVAESPIAGTVGEYLSGWNPLNNPHPNETPSQKLRREARESDEKYKAAVKKLDLLRCTLEEAMMEHLKFMERCELDRLRAIKSVILDFSGAISNVIPSLQSSVDNMMLYQETVQPEGDLRYLIENHRIGGFVPKVTVYENYYNSLGEQTFGVDLEARARADKKRVPLVITSILMFLDDQYPLLEGDEARQAIWLADVPLSATHRLRREINEGNEAPSSDLFDRYEVPIVASALKLYLLELPDSLVSSSVYEIIKTIYTSPATSDPAASSTRVSVIQNTLSQLRLANIATLDAISTHFQRLLDLTSADETYTNTLVASLAPCILRPKNETVLSLEEKYSSRFLRDLFEHKHAIFTELKRNASGLSHSASVLRAASDAGARARGLSTDESNRRVHVEERNRAIVNRSRASSPAPHGGPTDNSERSERGGAAGAAANERGTVAERRHRRDSSMGRFPINVSGTPKPVGHRNTGSTPKAARNSLEVPSSVENSPVAERTGTGVITRAAGEPVVANGHAKHDTTSSITSNPSFMPPEVQRSESAIETPTSASSKPEAAAAATMSTRHVGVELSDKPVDD